VIDAPVPKVPCRLEDQTMRELRSRPPASAATPMKWMMLPAANVALSTGVWILTVGADVDADDVSIALVVS